MVRIYHVRKLDRWKSSPVADHARSATVPTELKVGQKVGQAKCCKYTETYDCPGFSRFLPFFCPSQHRFAPKTTKSKLLVAIYLTLWHIVLYLSAVAETNKSLIHNI